MANMDDVYEAIKNKVGDKKYKIRVNMRVENDVLESAGIDLYKVYESKAEQPVLADKKDAGKVEVSVTKTSTKKGKEGMTTIEKILETKHKHMAYKKGQKNG